jgi:hypothetical protein
MDDRRVMQRPRIPPAISSGMSDKVSASRKVAAPLSTPGAYSQRTAPNPSQRGMNAPQEPPRWGRDEVRPPPREPPRWGMDGGDNDKAPPYFPSGPRGDSR